MSDQTHRLLLDACEMLTRCAEQDDTTVYWLRAEYRGHPAAARFDRDGGSSSVVPDPTAAQASIPDRAWQAMQRRQRLTGQLWRLVAELDDIRRTAAPADPQRARQAMQDDPTFWCMQHLAVGAHLERHRGDLCRPCYDRRKDPPDEQDLRYHAQHLRWPGIRVKRRKR